MVKAGIFVDETVPEVPVVKTILAVNAIDYVPPTANGPVNVFVTVVPLITIVTVVIVALE